MMLSASCFCPNELALCLRYHHDHEIPDPEGWSACDPQKILLVSGKAYQLPVVEMALAGARMLRGVISATDGQRALKDIIVDAAYLGIATSYPTSLPRRSC